MHDTIKEYLLYNEWATQKLIDYCKQVKGDDWDVELKGSFTSLRKTFYHIIDAQSIWLQRLDGAQSLHIFSKQNPTIATAFEVYTQTSAELRNSFAKTNNESLMQAIEVTDLQGNVHNDSRATIFLHVVNHGTFHRGQMINYLRALGYIDNIPGTDFIKYKRSLKH